MHKTKHRQIVSLAINSLRPGFIYLVKSNLNTLVWLLQDLNPTYVVYPKTSEFYEQLSYLAHYNRYVVFIVDTDRVTSKSSHAQAIPDVKFRQIDTKSYFFIVPDGLTLVDPKPLYKKLIGGQYLELDLEQLVRQHSKDSKDPFLKHAYPCNAYRHYLEGQVPNTTDHSFYLQRLLDHTFSAPNSEDGTPVYYYWRNQSPSLLHSLYRPEYFLRASYFCKDLIPYANQLFERLNRQTTAQAMHQLGLFGYFLSRSFKLTKTVKNQTTYYNLTPLNTRIDLWKQTLY